LDPFFIFFSSGCDIGSVLAGCCKKGEGFRGWRMCGGLRDSLTWWEGHVKLLLGIQRDFQIAGVLQKRERGFFGGVEEVVVTIQLDLVGGSWWEGRVKLVTCSPKKESC
jgi:hypothetical protein